MKRFIFLCIAIILLILICGFSQTALDPQDYSGKWYSSADQKVYLFQEGLIYGPSKTTALCGAYSYSRNSIYLFVTGMEGLEQEKALFLVKNRDGSFLCESPDGSGKLYFIRYNP